MEKQKKQILSENLRVLLFKFSIPTVTGMMIIALYNFVDAIFVGNVIGPNAIAGLTIILPVIILIVAIGLLTGVGAASIVSRSLGKGDKEKAIIAGGDSIILNTILNIIIITPIYLFSDRILKFLGASSEVLPYAKDYLEIMLFGFIFLSFAVNGTNLIRAEGKPRASMYEMIIGSILNIILDYIFIVVFRWGVQGAAIATVISHMASSVYILVFFMSGKSIFHIKFNMFKINKSISRKILSLGVPSFLMEIIGSVAFILFIRMVRQYGGDIYIAITGIGIRIVDLIFMPIVGISQGFSPIVGFNYGAKKYHRVKKVLKEAFIWTTSIAIAGFIIMVGFPQILINIFTNDPDLIEKGAMPLRLIASLIPLWAFPILGGTFFQAIGKARPALVITLSRNIIIFIPAIFILPIFFGLTGVWISWPVVDFLSFLIVGIFLIREIRIINKNIEIEKIKT
ncbi:MAG: MATE family efflux transporter [Actinobacteria bacterium]|nr:MAG: MATE family efflux transporter [Actinomycetota bacterium]